jgi:hypothetical protein
VYLALSVRDQSISYGEAAAVLSHYAALGSPDAQSEDPGFPIGIYVSDGLIF